MSQSFRADLDVAESSFAGPGAQEPKRLINSTQGRHINGLAADSSSSADTGRVFSGSRIDDGVHQDLQRVL